MIDKNFNDKNGNELYIDSWVLFSDPLLGNGYGTIVEFTDYNQVWIKVYSIIPYLVRSNIIGFFNTSLEKLPDIKEEREQILFLKRLEQ